MKIKTRRYYVYYAARVMFFIVQLVPRGIGLFIAEMMGKAAFRLFKKYRDIAESNLNNVFCGNEEKNTKIAESVFVNLAKNGVDWVKLMVLSRHKIESLVTEIEGLSYLDDELSKGKGIILLASHFGNWELLSIYLWLKGYRGAIIARRLYFHKYDKIITKMRSRFGSHVIYRDESPKKILRVLKDGKILGILADQNIQSIGGAFVDFFGRPTHTPTAPVRLAMASGAEIVPAFMIRKDDDTYKLVIEKAIGVSGHENRGGDEVKKYTQIWSYVLESYVRKYPDQWVWIHERWKTKQA